MAFEQGLKRLAAAVEQAARRESTWTARARAGLVALLGFLDDEPRCGLLLFGRGEAASAQALRREQRVLAVVAGLLEAEGQRASGTLGPSHLLDELVAGGVYAVIRARLLEWDDRPIVELAPELLAFIALHYLGQAGASAELAGMPAPVRDGSGRAAPGPVVEARGAELPMRMTRRTLLALRAIASMPRCSNRAVARAAGMADEGQASRLLSRLQARGLVENLSAGAARGECNAWLLTARGRRALGVSGGVSRASGVVRRGGLSDGGLA